MDINSYKVKEIKRIKAIVRGHLYSIGEMPRNIKKSSDELYYTRYCSIIIRNTHFTFKTKYAVVKVLFEDIKEFYLKNSETFVFIMKTKKTHHFDVN